MHLVVRDANISNGACFLHGTRSHLLPPARRHATAHVVAGSPSSVGATHCSWTSSVYGTVRSLTPPSQPARCRCTALMGDGLLAMGTGMFLGACGMEECVTLFRMDPMMHAYSLSQITARMPRVGYDDTVLISPEC
jgi:hypothetical protein